MTPALGKSYIAFALDGLRHQLSQGAGGWTLEPGDRWTFYKLTDSIAPKPTGHEKDFFDGIDTTLPGLITHIGSDKNNFPLLERALSEIAEKIHKAHEDSDHTEQAAVPLLQAEEQTRCSGRSQRANRHRPGKGPDFIDFVRKTTSVRKCGESRSERFCTGSGRQTERARSAVAQ